MSGRPRMTELSQEENSVHTLLPTQGHTVFIYLSLPRVCLLSLSDLVDKCVSPSPSLNFLFGSWLWSENFITSAVSKLYIVTVNNDALRFVLSATPHAIAFQSRCCEAPEGGWKYCAWFPSLRPYSHWENVGALRTIGVSEQKKERGRERERGG